MRRICINVAVGCGVFLFAGCSSSGDGEKGLIETSGIAEQQMLQEAMQAYDKGLYTASAKQFTELRESYPASYYGALAQLKTADSLFFHGGDYKAAAASYEEFVRVRPGHESAPYAMFQVGQSQMAEYRGIDRDQSPLKEADRAFRQVIEKYPRDEYALKAKQELARIKAYRAEHEELVAAFYEKTGKDNAANFRRNHSTSTTTSLDVKDSDSEDQGKLTQESLPDARGRLK